MSYDNKIDIRKLNIWFGNKHVINDLDLKIKANAVTAIMGPSGCGKSTLLRALNRMNDVIKSSKTTGDIFIGEKNIYENNTNVYDLRRQVGMVFQKPNPLPKSIYENIAFGPKIHKTAKGKTLDKIVEKSLRAAALWDEVDDRLNDSAFDLSGGQQQRLCIARALAVDPEVILMDEPCSALDPAATAKIEQLIRVLSTDYTVVIVTHNMQQASRVSDYTVFLYLGEIIEQGDTKGIFDARAFADYREDLLHLVKRLDTFSDHVKDAARCIKMLGDAQIPDELWKKAVHVTETLVDCATALRSSIQNISANPTEAMKGAKKVEEIEARIDKEYLATKSLFIKYAEQMNSGALIIFDDMVEFLEEAADMCADTADYIVTLASA